MLVAVFRILCRFIAALARLAVRSGHSKDTEIIVLVHQLSDLHRQIDRPRINDNVRSLAADTFAERWIRTLRRELLDPTII